MAHSSCGPAQGLKRAWVCLGQAYANVYVHILKKQGMSVGRASSAEMSVCLSECLSPCMLDYLKPCGCPVLSAVIRECSSPSLRHQEGEWYSPVLSSYMRELHLWD